MEELVDGIFAQIERVKTSNATVQMTQIDGWKEKIVEWIREQNINGKKIKKTANKKLNETMRIKLEPDEKASKKFTGPCTKMLNICKKMPVHKVLKAAKAQTFKRQRSVSFSDSRGAMIRNESKPFVAPQTPSISILDEQQDSSFMYDTNIWEDVGMRDGVEYLNCKYCNKLIAKKEKLVETHLSMEDHRRNMGELIIDWD